jgi:hypothetical protein
MGEQNEHAAPPMLLQPYCSVSHCYVSMACYGSTQRIYIGGCEGVFVLLSWDEMVATERPWFSMVSKTHVTLKDSINVQSKCFIPSIFCDKLNHMVLVII